jgi:two-component system chemotaxis sensor kinase CheA
MNTKENYDDPLDDLDDLAEPKKYIPIVAIISSEIFLKKINQTQSINPELQIQIIPHGSPLESVFDKTHIFLVECRVLAFYDDLQVIRNIHQKRPLTPIIAMTQSDDMNLHSIIYSSGTLEVLNENFEPQILNIKFLSYAGLAETTGLLEIKNQESIQAMRSLRQANEQLKKEMDSRIAAEREKAIAEKTAEENKLIREIMDHLKEGYFSFGKDLIIGQQTSKACLSIFGQDIASYKISSGQGLNFLDSKLESHVSSCLDQIFDNILPYSVSLSMLPKKTTLKNKKIITMDFEIIESNREPEKIICIAKDITVEEEEAKKNSEFQKNNQIILNILRNKENFIGFLIDFRKKILEIQKNTLNKTETKRILHTLKGNSAVYGLTDIAHGIHEMENQLDSASPEEFLLKIQDLEHLIEKFLTLHNEALRIPYPELYMTYSVEENILNQLSQIAEACPPGEKEALLESINQIKLKPASFFTTLFENTVSGLAKSLGKKIRIRILGLEIRIPFQSIESVLKNLVHIIRNACDHGIEHPEDRKNKGKPEEGLIIVSFAQNKEDKTITISIKDDGKGIDTIKLVAKALENKVIDEKKSELLSEQDTLGLIFYDGISTAEEVSEISGRGVGMASVKNAVSELGGHIFVESEKDKGTTINITLNEHPSTKNEPNKEVHTIKIMICEDEEFLRELYSDALKQRGFGVNAFDNGLDALIELSKEKYDLIITDIRMPGLEGGTIIHKIRELSTDSDKTPIIIISGFVSYQMQKDFETYSNVTVLEKPITMKRLIPIIEKYLSLA